MPTDSITYQNSGHCTTIIKDYLEQNNRLTSFYNRFPSLENFEKQIQEKKTTYTNKTRDKLVAVLKKQYKSIAISDGTKNNIEFLLQSHTFTITTGHQLNLFTGPLYFLYKIITAINLTSELKTKYPEYNFVPVYWMATEDHDFEEINYFNLNGKKLQWDKKSSGAVGNVTTAGLDAFFEIFSSEIGSNNSAIELKLMFKEAYLKHENLTDATRHLANTLFGKYGLVILDAADSNLKKEFVPYIKDELLTGSSFELVRETNKKLAAYPTQVNPREINLFYLENKLRERIIKDKNVYTINNTAVAFSELEIMQELKNYPEKFSPNVLLRPLYQEVILPNLCYIGGGGELAYWLELKSYFEYSKITFPILLLRNSVLLTSKKQKEKAIKLGLTWKDLFLNQSELLNKKVAELSEFPIDLSNLKKVLKNQFTYLNALSKKTDASFLGAVKAQEKKQNKGLDNLEKRLLKAQKKQHSEVLLRIISLQNELFPNASLQERNCNFSEWYKQFGGAFIETLFLEIQPLNTEFKIIVL